MRFLDVRLEASSNGVRADSGDLTEGPGLQFALQMICLSGPHSDRHEDGTYTSCCDFSYVYINLSHLHLHGFGGRAVFVLNDSKPEGQ